MWNTTNRHTLYGGLFLADRYHHNLAAGGLELALVFLAINKRGTEQCCRCLSYSHIELHADQLMDVGNTAGISVQMYDVTQSVEFHHS